MYKIDKKIVIKNALYPFLGLVIFFVVWAITSAVYDKPLMLSSPLDTVKAAVNLLKTGNFWLRIGNSFITSVFGFVISILVALPLAILTIMLDIKKIISPIVTIIRAVPTVTVIMLIFLWTDPFVTPIIVSTLVVLPILYSSLLLTLSGVNKDLIETTKVFGFGKLGIMRYVYLPSLKKSLVENTASGISLSFKIVISAEIIVSTKNSIGSFIKAADRNMQIANFFAAALVVALLCIIIELLIRLPLSNKNLFD